MSKKVDQKQLVAYVQDIFKQTSKINSLMVELLVASGMEPMEAVHSMMGGVLGPETSSMLEDAVRADLAKPKK